MGDGGIGEAARADRVSLWIDSTGGDPTRAPLTGTTTADAVVVGAGIAGLSTALLLALTGRSVVVLDADVVGGGTSGYTSAKVTAGHGTTYSHLAAHHDASVARRYAESQSVALETIREWSARFGIHCDLESQPNVIYASSADEIPALEAEAEAARAAGLSVRFERSSPHHFAAAELSLPRQNQFHVRRYLLGLARQIELHGGTIHERSRVVEITGSDPLEVSTRNGSARAPIVVVATHYPIVGQGFFATRIHPRRSYVVAAELEEEEPAGMYINAGSPTRSFRSAPADDGRLLLVGGEGHRVGQDRHSADHYDTLETWTREHFAVGAVRYRWSTQDTFSVDGLPYIGRLDAKSNIYVATGFAGWGMTNGTVAGTVISDLVQGIENDWQALYSLDRHHPSAAATKFMRENANVATQQAHGALDGGAERLDEIVPGKGQVTKIDGRPAAVHRTLDGSLIAVSASCTHMGCHVAWNDAEASWDCPCHGSRFAPDGHVLHGPALHDLEVIALPASETTR